MEKMKDKKITCLGCFTEIEVPDELKPSPGDVNICHKCGKLFIFSGSMQLVEMTGEMETVFRMKYPRHWEAICGVRQRIAMRARHN
jgi:hypothetical protein